MTLRVGGEVAGIGILGVGTAFPADRGRWVQNHDIHVLLHGPDWQIEMERLGLAPDHYEKSAGFSRRYWTHVPGTEFGPEEPTTTDLMEAAARDALRSAAVEPEEIDLLIAFTTTSNRMTTSQGALAGGRLGLRCPTFEIKSGCSSAVYALATAYRYAAGGARRVLVAGAETLSKVTPPRAPLAYAAADGGAAVVLGAVSALEQSGRGLIADYLDSDGARSNLMGVPGPLPPTTQALNSEQYFMHMDRRATEAALEKWSLAPRALLAASGIAAREIEAYVPHQPNRKLIQAGAESVGIEPGRVVDVVSEFANCGSVSILVALHRAFTEGRIGPGSLVMLNAVGGGLAWGGLLLRI